MIKDTPDEAIRVAKEHAIEIGFVDFEGNNCSDSWDEGAECQGWDGESRRCDCGNRRVYWDTDTTVDGKFYAVAMTD